MTVLKFVWYIELHLTVKKLLPSPFFLANTFIVIVCNMLVNF